MPNSQANFVDFLRLILSPTMYKEPHLKNRANVPPYDPGAPAVCDIKQITRMLPHRYPFQMVDKIIHLDAKSIIGVKNVTINEPFFQGHFPGNPIMPGVLQVEALAQTGGVLVLSTVPDPENYLTYFLGIDGCRFRKMVVPGDTLVLHCELLADIKRGFSKMQGRVFVGEQLACEAIMLAQISKKQ
ncbi:MAG TPA: 3-hydroxyacyl-[acyl-carrier-protein] dehydratase FabZ [Amoebophilaceae bacterium]|nr:3-hydroxyacyl-[acyl-carrier-protein] dehydratase FabZ [Amoebophilaceae bacterium]